MFHSLSPAPEISLSQIQLLIVSIKLSQAYYHQQAQSSLFCNCHVGYVGKVRISITP